VIAFGDTRAHALFNLFQFLKGYSVHGVPTTIPFHAWILANKDFQETGIDIGYVERTFNAACADEAEKLLYLDPAHKESHVKGNSIAERVYLRDKAGDLKAVDIVHEHGGTFLAIPLSSTGAPQEKSTWRRSNIREAVIQAVQSAI
jgi:acetyl/propionyl-CoA carboxylase alpha subunit